MPMIVGEEFEIVDDVSIPKISNACIVMGFLRV